MRKNTPVSLGLHHQTIIEDSVAWGCYRNTSEVIRAGLRLLDEEENRFRLLSSAIDEGINSGFAIDFDAHAHLKGLKTKRKTNGWLPPRSKQNFL
jgi:antitoxin ParD1/3/4